MAEEKKTPNLCKEENKREREEKGKESVKFKSATFLWLLYFSLTAVLVLAVTAFLQKQIVSLQEELSNLKGNLTCVCQEEKPRNLRKRSSSEEDAVSQGVGLEAAYLHGTFPFQHIQKQGRIGPWTVSSTYDSFINMKEKNTEIEITQTGIYYVYAQIYYLTSQPHNSFQIITYNGTEPRKLHRNLAVCSSQGRNSMGEASCYTGLTASFHSGQRLYLNQIEQNRLIHFTDGCSHFGVVLLRKNASLALAKTKPH